MDLPERLALDTNCFVYAFDDPSSGRGRFVAERLLQGGPRWTSALVLAELLTRPYDVGEPARALTLRRALETLPGLTISPLTADVAQQAARLRAERRLSLPDAAVLATALAADAVLVTNDRRLREAAGAEGVLLDDLVAES